MTEASSKILLLTKPVLIFANEASENPPLAKVHYSFRDKSQLNTKIPSRYRYQQIYEHLISNLADTRSGWSLTELWQAKLANKAKCTLYNASQPTFRLKRRATY